MYCGVEGGGTKTHVSIISADGRILGHSIGESSNHWRIGIGSTVQRIADLIIEAKKDAGLPDDTVLNGVGMCLSGVDTHESKLCIEKEMKTFYPNLAKEAHVWNDAVGAISTISDTGGIVLIAGTGSICMYINAEGDCHRIGGYGHMLGDEGSAYWIVHKGAKLLIDHKDGVRPVSQSTAALEKIIFDYFHTDYCGGLLEYFYTKFDKTFVAKACVNLAKAAEEGDPLCIRIFYDAGYVLARQAIAMLSKFKLGESATILCVGSVWKSWHLVKEGFIEGMKPSFETDVKLKEFSLTHLKAEATIGSAVMCAKTMGVHIPVKYKDNYDVFYKHTF